MIKNLEAVMLANGDLECYYAVDDEGNAYHPIHFEPSVYYINQYGDVFQDEDLEDELRVTVIATGFEQKADAPVIKAPVAAAAPAEAPAAKAKPVDIADIDEIFSIFKR